jgi:hypothetical protein
MTDSSRFTAAGSRMRVAGFFSASGFVAGIFLNILSFFAFFVCSAVFLMV